MSQNSNTKEYMIILHNKYFDKGFEKYCVKCGKIYTDIQYKWCIPCQVEENTSGNEKIDNLIQEMQLKVNDERNIMFEWIPYNQFNDIREIGKGEFARIYSAKWKDGPLNYYFNKRKYIKDSNITVALKCLHNSQNISSEFFYEVRNFSLNLIKY